MRIKFILLLAVICCICACTDNKEKALQHLKTGKGMLFRNEFSAAAEEFTKALEYDNGLDQAWYYRANARFNDKNLEGALADYDQCIALNSGFADAYNNRAGLKFAMGDKDGACSDWKKAYELGMKNLRDRLQGCP